tara:strand:- start:527 stop:661 length:135 start_codon:yes stop_codon:yes gene_type:complete
MQNKTNMKVSWEETSAAAAQPGRPHAVNAQQTEKVVAAFQDVHV